MLSGSKSKKSFRSRRRRDKMDWDNSRAPVSFTDIGYTALSPMSNDRVIPNGTFTVESSRTGKHRTFRIHTAKSGNAKGARFVALLTGPDNQRNYRSFAVISNDWQHILVFRKLRAAPNEKPTDWETYACMLEVMLASDENWYTERGMTIKGSRKCAKCGRMLTEPESLRAGIGPVCRGER